MKYVYRCKYGTMEIYKRPDGKYVLSNGEDEFDTADSAMAVADNVYTHETGWDRWDNSKLDGPADLSEWDQISS